jgi:hypothetical protein
MAILKAEIDFDLDGLNKLAKQFPDFSGGLLQLVGSKSRKVLYNKYLRGADINLSAYPKNSKGQYTIISDVNKKQTEVKIYSPTMMLFNNPHKLRSGSMSEGKYTITRKLKQDIMMNVAGYTKEFETRFLQKALDKV